MALRIILAATVFGFSLSSATAQFMGHEYEGAAAPIRKGEKPVIPLDTKDPSYNAWRQLRDFTKDKRKPGIINVQKYNFGYSFNAMPTFFNLPIALTPADLKVSKVEVAIMGAVPDMGVGMRGAAHGPNAVRNSQVHGGYGARQPHMHTMTDPLQELVIADFGNAPIDIMSMERSMHAIRSFVKSSIVDIGKGKKTIPIIVGGDHSLMYADVAALVDVYGKGNVGVVHFDAHYDAGKFGQGHLISHGMPVYRLIEEGLVPGKNFIQVGLRGYYPDEAAFRRMRKQGFRYHTMAEIEDRGFKAVMEDVLKEANDGLKYIFVSFDIDVLDPAFVSGTGTPEPGGLTPREVFPILRRLCAETNLVGMELVELSPFLDPTYVSALNANRLLKECMTGIAMRKKGLTGRHYLSPLTKRHGRVK
jgi:formimidoylglutamase